MYIFMRVLAQRKLEIYYYCKRTSETWPVSLLVAVNRARTEILDVVQVIGLVYAQIEKE
jgi:hypothetical protein